VFAGLLVLLAAAVLALAQWLEPWLAALVVGIVVVIIGVLLLLAGKQKLHPEQLKPERSAESLRRDKDVLVRKSS
jgi:xanthine/uracil permease